MSRHYESTHPWITFKISRRQAEDQHLWAMLGECQSKSEHIAGAPIDPEIANNLHAVYCVKGIRGTAAIEGNTLSEEEIQKKIEGKLVLPPSREYLAQEVENIIAGLGEVTRDALCGSPHPLSRKTIEGFNKTLLQKLEVEDGVIPGDIRTHSVGVFGYRGAPAEDCELLLDSLCDWLNGPDFEGPSDLRVALAIIKAAIAHLYLAWIHPFGDGNGRTARLVEFSILFNAGIPTPAAHLLSNHYNLTRSEYYRQLDMASASGGETLKFINYATQGLLDGLREQLSVIRASQLDKIWQNYVYEAFGNTATSAANLRRRLLVLELSKQTEPIKLSKLVKGSPELALQYAGATKVKFSRDLNGLAAMKLIVRGKEGLLANKDIVRGFLPQRATVVMPSVIGSGEMRAAIA